MEALGDLVGGEAQPDESEDLEFAFGEGGERAEVETHLAVDLLRADEVGEPDGLAERDAHGEDALVPLRVVERAVDRSAEEPGDRAQDGDAAAVLQHARDQRHARVVDGARDELGEIAALDRVKRLEADQVAPELIHVVNDALSVDHGHGARRVVGEGLPADRPLGRRHFVFRRVRAAREPWALHEHGRSLSPGVDPSAGAPRA